MSTRRAFVRVPIVVTAALALSVVGFAQLAVPAAAQGSPITCNVTAYGADPSGVQDSTLAIRQAIVTCEATAGPNTVYLPAGTYKLDLNDGGVHGSNNDLLITGGYPIVFAGAGAATTSIVEWIGSRTTCGTSPCFPKDLLYALTDGTTVTGVTLDTQTHDADRAFQTTANDVTLANSTVLGGDHSYAIRFNGGRGSPKSAPIRATGNVIHDVILNDQSGSVYAGLDFSFQQYGKIYNIQHTGSRLGLYVPSHVDVTNYTYRPGVQGGVGGAARGFFITPPADNVTITGFHSYGQGGVIAPDPTYETHNITITDEQIFNQTSGGYVDQLSVGEVTGLTVNSSSMPRLQIAPQVFAGGITVTATTAAIVWCNPTAGAVIGSVSGVQCPTSIKVGSSNRAPRAGQTVTLTGTVKSTGGAPSGSVTFLVNGVAAKTVALVGDVASWATSNLAYGMDRITVQYNGAGHFALSTAGPITEHVAH
jgi:hypothetical protein